MVPDMPLPVKCHLLPESHSEKLCDRHRWSILNPEVIPLVVLPLKTQGSDRLRTFLCPSHSAALESVTNHMTASTLRCADGVS